MSLVLPLCLLCFYRTLWLLQPPLCGPPPPLSPPCPFLSFLSTCPELQSWGPTCLGAISDLVKLKFITSFLHGLVPLPPSSQHSLCG